MSPIPTPLRLAPLVAALLLPVACGGGSEPDEAPVAQDASGGEERFVVAQGSRSGTIVRRTN